MSYTPSPFRPKTSVTFNGLISDGNRNALTGALGNGFVTRDASASPNTSPLSFSGSTVTLTVPANATEFSVTAGADALKVSEDSTMSEYWQVTAGVNITLPCARQEYIYLAGTSSDTVSFAFNLV